jgi:SET domain-containing protein
LDEDSRLAIEVQNVFKYINHNSKPNACYYDDLTVVALRDIEKDEEITHHYGECWDE